MIRIRVIRRSKKHGGDGGDNGGDSGGGGYTYIQLNERVWHYAATKPACVSAVTPNPQCIEATTTDEETKNFREIGVFIIIY